MVDLSGLDVPENNREIALHLKGIREGQGSTDRRIQHLEQKVDGLETRVGEKVDNLETTLGDRVTQLEKKIDDRRFKLQDVFISALCFPVVGGILLFLLQKALG